MLRMQGRPAGTVTALHNGIVSKVQSTTRTGRTSSEGPKFVHSSTTNFPGIVS